MANPAGSFIWYELMTPDPDGAAAFYGPVIGWKIARPSRSPSLRMPGKSSRPATFVRRMKTAFGFASMNGCNPKYCGVAARNPDGARAANPVPRNPRRDRSMVQCSESIISQTRPSGNCHQFDHFPR